MAEGSSSTAHTQRTIMAQQYFAALVKRFLFNDRGTVLIKFPIRSSRSLVHPETFFVQNEIGHENEARPEISSRFQERHISGSHQQVKRLFSISGHILSQRRLKTTDKNFKNILFAKVNYEVFDAELRKRKQLDNDGNN